MKKSLSQMLKEQLIAHINSQEAESNGLNDLQAFLNGTAMFFIELAENNVFKERDRYKKISIKELFDAKSYNEAALYNFLTYKERRQEAYCEKKEITL